MLSNLILFFGFVIFLMTLPGVVELLYLTSGAFLEYLFPKSTHQSPPISPLKTAAIIPAHNEAKHITKTIKSLQASGFMEDVWVIADNCDDNTAEIARREGAQVLERKDQNHRGKHYALRFAFENLLKSDYAAFIIIDADTLVNEEIKEVLNKAYQNGADAVQLYNGLHQPNPTIMTRFLYLAFEAFNHVRPLGRKYWNLSAGILGNGFSLSRSTLETVPFSTQSVVEDLEYHLLLVEAGRKVEYFDEARVFSEPQMQSKGASEQRSRWEGGRLRMLVDFGPRLFKGILNGNFANIEPLLDLCLFPLSYHVILLLILLFMPNLFLVDYALFGFFVLFFHGIVTLLIAKATWKDVLSIFIAPFYILWKLKIISKILKGASKSFHWLRSER